MDNLYEKLSEERKQLQDSGKLPEWYSTGGWQLFKSKYLYDAPHWKAQIKRICKTAAKHTTNPQEWEDKFFELFWKGWLSPSTPVLANMGTDRGLPVSCSGCYVDDSVSGFYETATEIAVLSKNGFGTSAYVGDIRPRGTKIYGGGKASGAVPVIKMLSQVCEDISQGSSRRGAGAWYYPIDGGDFYEILNLIETKPDGLNIGWNVSDAFIEKLNQGDTEALNRYQQALRVKLTLGKGYFCFIDKANRQRPQCYIDRGLDIKASQLCSEIILHSSKEFSYTCVLSSMNVALYDEWKDTDAVFTATVFLDCVASEFIEQAKDIKHLHKAVDFTRRGRALGLGQMGLFSLFQKRMLNAESFDAHRLNVEVAKHIDEESLKASQWMAKEFGEPEWCEGYGLRNSHRCVKGDTKVLTDKGQFEIKDIVGKEVSVWNGNKFSKTVPFETGVSELYRVKFSNGLYLDCTADHKFLVATPKRDTKEFGGLKTIEVETINLRVGDCMPKFMTESTCSGLDLPYAYTAGMFCGDGSVSNARAGKYPRNELRLYGDKKSLSEFIDWKSETTWGGEDCVRGYLPDDILPKYVVPLQYSKESKQKWLSGLVDSDGTASSKGVSISMRDYAFAVDVALLVQSLGGEPFVHTVNRSGGYSSDNNEYFVVTISLHSISKVFDTFKPKRVKCNVQKNKTKVGKRHLVEVVSVESLGVSEMTYCFTESFEGQGVFNGILTKQCAIAPTKSTALLMGGWSEGIGPEPAMAFSSSGAAGDIDRVSPVLLEVMKKKKLDIKKCTNQILADNGSVQNVDWLSDEEKDVFKNAFEIDQHVLVRLASARQNFIDQGQSLNLFFAHNDTEQYVSSVHKEAFLNENILSLYYVYSNSALKAQRTEECEACM